MKTVIYSYPKSSFLSLEKDLDSIVGMVMKNNNLKRLLYYNSKDCLTKPALNEDETLKLFEENIKIVPLIEITNEMLNYLTITFDGFTPNATNPQFRDNLIKFHIYCPFEQWQLKDFQMRPYKLAAEIDTMFNNKHLTGIGTLEFVGAEQFFMEDVPYGGLCLLYRAIHGGEDQKKMPNPNDEEQFVENYNQLYNN